MGMVGHFIASNLVFTWAVTDMDFPSLSNRSFFVLGLLLRYRILDGIRMSVYHIEMITCLDTNKYYRNLFSLRRPYLLTLLVIFDSLSFTFPGKDMVNNLSLIMINITVPPSTYRRCVMIAYRYDKRSCADIDKVSAW